MTWALCPPKLIWRTGKHSYTWISKFKIKYTNQQSNARKKETMSSVVTKSTNYRNHLLFGFFLSSRIIWEYTGVFRWKFKVCTVFLCAIFSLVCFTQSFHCLLLHAYVICMIHNNWSHVDFFQFEYNIWSFWAKSYQWKLGEIASSNSFMFFDSVRWFAVTNFKSGNNTKHTKT